VPGRYEHNRDPQLAELLHRVTVEGWGNDSVGDLDEDGFHASLLIVEPAEQQELTDAFNRAIPAGSWDLTEDQQGLVTVDPTRRRPGTPSTTCPTWTALGRRTAPSPRPGHSAAYTRSPGPSSATPTTWSRRPRCCGRRWPPTVPGQMPGSSAITATPTVSTSGRRDQAPRPLQDLAPGMAAVLLVGLRPNG
jgi:hypothetical protein